MGQPIEIKDAQPIGLLMVAVEWTDGSTSLIDMGIKLLADPALSHIAFDDGLFSTLTKSEDGSALVWADGSRMAASDLADGEGRVAP
jgi:hypothetical protein